VELAALRTFLAVVEEGGILAASRKLNTVQSNVTGRIQRLEAELGQQLFHRSGRRLELAPAGRALRGYAEQMLALEQQTRNAIDTLGEQCGELRIGSMETFAAMHLPRGLMQLRARHPRIKLKVEAGTTSEMVERVRSRKLDCAFVGGPVEDALLEAEIVLTEELVLVTARNFDAKQLPLIVFREGCAYRARALTWQRECGHPDVEVMDLGTLDGILGCVAVGLGCTLMPSWIVDESIYADRLAKRELPPQIARIPTLMIRRRDMPRLAALSTLRDSVAKEDHQPGQNAVP
jgi:DNA-binding transcriptional LysR family regulator